MAPNEGALAHRQKVCRVRDGAFARGRLGKICKAPDARAEQNGRINRRVGVQDYAIDLHLLSLLEKC